MPKIRKPVLLTFSLVLIAGMFYLMSSQDHLGEAVPVTLQKYKVNDNKEIILNTQDDAEQWVDEIPPVIETSKDTEGTYKDSKAKAPSPSVPKGSSEPPKLNTPLSNLLPDKGSLKEPAGSDEDSSVSSLDEPGLTAFMPKMTNETLKAELGNAAWKLFHTILARYPDKPTVDERSTLTQYIHLFAQVYPCGDCARHFQKLLQQSPPQTSSRKTAALWGCAMHNKVNDRLGKPEYDCSTVLEDYDCGCGDDEKEKDDTLGGATLKDKTNDSRVSEAKTPYKSEKYTAEKVTTEEDTPKNKIGQKADKKIAETGGKKTSQIAEKTPEISAHKVPVGSEKVAVGSEKKSAISAKIAPLLEKKIQEDAKKKFTETAEKKTAQMTEKKPLNPVSKKKPIVSAKENLGHLNQIKVDKAEGLQAG